jgi:uncharacterized protein YbjT (DUF2867 family)
VVINTAGIIQEHGANTFVAVHRDGPIALFRAAERAGVRRVIQVSAIGADAQAETGYHRTKRDADEVLRALSLQGVILQPSLVYGREGRSYAFFSALAALPVLLMPGRGDQRLQPVHVDDLVEGIVRLARSDAPSRVTLAVVGPGSVTFRQFMETVRRWLGLSTGLVWSVPMGLVRMFVRIGDVFHAEFVNTDTLSMLCRGNKADPNPFVAATGVEPRSVSEGMPIHGASRQEFAAACLYVLRPLLLLSIALVWIGSGVVSLFAFPHETSAAWLMRVGIPSAWTEGTLVIAATLDIALGVATILRWRISLVLELQLVLIIGFSALLTARMPELWGHPFGPLLKNLPLFVATLILWALERRG